MPVKSSISDGIIYVEISGTLNVDHCLQHVDFLINQKGKIKNRYELIDFLHAESIELEGDDFEKIFRYATQLKNVFEHSFVAIYSNSDLKYGLSRMFQLHHELSAHPSAIEVFREKEIAIEFLNNARKKHG